MEEEGHEARRRKVVCSGQEAEANKLITYQLGFVGNERSFLRSGRNDAMV
jgi:hypothetical protein